MAGSRPAEPKINDPLRKPTETDTRHIRAPAIGGDRDFCWYLWVDQRAVKLKSKRRKANSQKPLHVIIIDLLDDKPEF